MGRYGNVAPGARGTLQPKLGGISSRPLTKAPMRPSPGNSGPVAQGRGVVNQGGVQGVEGRGGNFQPLGKAALSRLPGGGGDFGDRGVFQQKPLDAGIGSGGAGIEAAIGGLKQQLGMPPTSSGRPAQLQGDQLAQALERRGMPFGGGGIGGDPAGGRGFEPPSMQPDPNDPRTKDFIAQMVRPGSPGASDMVTRPLPGINGGGGGFSGRPMPMDLETAEMGGQQTPPADEIATKLAGIGPQGQGGQGQGPGGAASGLLQRLKMMNGGGFMGGQQGQGQQPQVPGPGPSQGNPYANLLKQRLASVGAGGGMPGPVGTF